MMKEQLNFLVPIPEIDVSVILEILGDVHEQLFNYQKALNCYQKSYEVNNADNKLLYKIAVDQSTGKDNILEEFLKKQQGKRILRKC